MTYSLNWLQEQLNQDKQLEYLFFWGHTPPKDGSTDKSCFSQWFPAPFTVNGIEYLTAEHWMMWKKAILFGDKETAGEIVKTEKPAIAKELGRKVRNFDPAVWSAACFDIVVEGNKHKFEQHENMKNVLLYTGNKILVEASPVDTIWGIGLAKDHPDAANPFNWKGTNLLGFALMEVREWLRGL